MPSVALRRLLSISLMSLLLSMSGPKGSPSDAMAMAKFPDDTPEAKVVILARCPTLKSYSVEQSSKGAREMQALLKADPTAAAPGMFRDYGTLRNQCRSYPGAAK